CCLTAPVALNSQGMSLRSRPASGKPARFLLLPLAAALLALVARAGVAAAAVGDCGLPVNQTGPKSSDCLFILRSAVGSTNCAPCTCDVNNSADVTATDALLCLRVAVGQNIALECPACLSCPAFVEISSQSQGSELDLGWTGSAHEVELDDGATLRLAVDCEPGSSGCGECSIEGIDVAAGNCRCANDPRTICDSPFGT